IEGCLSVPDLVGEVERHNSVIVNGLDRHGKKQKIYATGWLARIFQHEIDHLNGILFVDRAKKIWKPEVDDEGKKMVKKPLLKIIARKVEIEYPVTEKGTM
ncbi:MAG: peptide deformylase, partial [Ignavibacteria bacterium]|nr:peptide deformylase [Ignavibacteria bacterium]